MTRTLGSVNKNQPEVVRGEDGIAVQAPTDFQLTVMPGGALVRDQSTSRAVRTVRRQMTLAMAERLLPLAQWEEDWGITNENQRRYLSCLALCGTSTLATELAGVSRSKPGTWRQKERERHERLEDGLPNLFAKAENFAKSQPGAEVLEEEAWRRAVDGVESPIFYRGALVGMERKYSDPLLAMLLKGTMPDKYGDRVRLNLSTDRTEAPQMPEDSDWRRDVIDILAGAVDAEIVEARPEPKVPLLASKSDDAEPNATAE